MMRRPLLAIASLAVAGCGADELPGPSRPPYDGTVWVSSDIIRDSDPTSFRELTPTGQGRREMFDRRINAFANYDAHLFDARFGTSTLVEIQVNPEFTAQEAEEEAAFYAEAIGRIPGFLFADLDTVWIHRGQQPFGGGNNNILIHTGDTFDEGFLEEVLVHEGAHTSMDAAHANASGWRAARQADPVHISTYAAEFPDREDVAETLLLYLAQRFRSNRLDPADVSKITRSVPNRLSYFDRLGLSMAVLE